MRFAFGVVVVASLTSGCAPAEGPADPARTDAPFHGDAGDAADAATAFLTTGDHRIAATDEILVRDVSFDRLGRAHVRVQQTYAGVLVFGREAIVHLAGEGTAWISDHFTSGLRVNPIPDLTSDDAVRIARAAVSPTVGPTSADLQILRYQGDHLVWVVRIEAYESAVPAIPIVFVDAHDGRVVWSYDDLQTARNRKTYDANNQQFLPGTLIRNEASAASGDATLDNAHDFAGSTYDYYFNEQGRDAYDGLGSSMSSSVHYSVAGG